MHDELKAAMNQEPSEEAGRQIPTQILENSEKIAVLQKTIAELEDRLTVVLQKQINNDEVAKQQMPSGLVPLAISLMEQSCQISKLIQAINDIMKRLEL